VSDGIITNIEDVNDSNFNKFSSADNTLVFGADDVIYPGLIDLHTHVSYNMIPVWKNPNPNAWDNRHEWRNNNDYKTNIPDVETHVIEGLLKSHGNDKTTVTNLLRYYAELQAVAGGTTLVQEDDPIDDTPPAPATNMVLIRDTGSPSDMRSSAKHIHSVIDFFKPLNIQRNLVPYVNTSDWTIDTSIDSSPRKAYNAFLNKGKNGSFGDVTTYLVHLGEGRAGNLRPKNHDTDAYSKLEFRTLMGDILPWHTKLLPQRLTIIHGCGVDLQDLDVINFIRASGTGFVWSPVSNLILYADTPRFYDAFKPASEAKNCKICLGSDWSPSGSKHVWDEAKFAYKFLRKNSIRAKTQTESETAHEVFDMITSTPSARVLLNQPMTVDGFADFFVLSTNAAKNAKLSVGDAALGLMGANDSHTRAVIVGGNVVYGDKTVTDAFRAYNQNLSYSQLPASEQPNGGTKCVLVPEGLGIDLGKDIAEISTLVADCSEKKTNYLSSVDTAYQKVVSELESKYTV
jgi:hypothetical protein